MAAYELLVVTPAIANLIRENKTFRINSAIQTGAKFGMQLQDDHLFRLWRDGVIAVEDALTKAHREDDLAKRVVQSLLTIFVESTLGDNREQTDSAQEFVDQQIKQYEAKLEAAEMRLAEFKRTHMGMMPGTAQAKLEIIGMIDCPDRPTDRIARSIR